MRPCCVTPTASAAMPRQLTPCRFSVSEGDIATAGWMTPRSGWSDDQRPWSPSIPDSRPSRVSRPGIPRSTAAGKAALGARSVVNMSASLQPARLMTARALRARAPVSSCLGVEPLATQIAYIAASALTAFVSSRKMMVACRKLNISWRNMGHLRSWSPCEAFRYGKFTSAWSCRGELASLSGRPLRDDLANFLEGTHLDLPHSLAGHAEFPGDFLELSRCVAEASGHENVSLSLVEQRQRLGQRLAALRQLLAIGENAFLARRLIGQQVLPAARIALLHRCTERHVAAQPPIHLDDVLFAHAEPFGDQLDLVGTHVAVVERGNPALGFAEIEEQLALVCRGSQLHQ